jgi:hypothetical protein
MCLCPHPTKETTFRIVSRKGPLPGEGSSRGRRSVSLPLTALADLRCCGPVQSGATVRGYGLKYPLVSASKRAGAILGSQYGARYEVDVFYAIKANDRHELLMDGRYSVKDQAPTVRS